MVRRWTHARSIYLYLPGPVCGVPRGKLNRWRLADHHLLVVDRGAQALKHCRHGLSTKQLAAPQNPQSAVLYAIIASTEQRLRSAARAERDGQPVHGSPRQLCRAHKDFKFKRSGFC